MAGAIISGTNRPVDESLPHRNVASSRRSIVVNLVNNELRVFYVGSKDQFGRVPHP